MTHLILDIIMYTVALKAMLIGSDFNFIRWMKEGKSYTKEYFKRYE